MWISATFKASNSSLRPNRDIRPAAGQSVLCLSLLCPPKVGLPLAYHWLLDIHVHCVPIPCIAVGGDVGILAFRANPDTGTSCFSRLRPWGHSSYLALCTVLRSTDNQVAGYRPSTIIAILPARQHSFPTRPPFLVPSPLRFSRPSDLLLLNLRSIVSIIGLRLRSYHSSFLGIVSLRALF